MTKWVTKRGTKWITRAQVRDKAGDRQGGRQSGRQTGRQTKRERHGGRQSRDRMRQSGRQAGCARCADGVFANGVDARVGTEMEGPGGHDNCGCADVAETACAQGHGWRWVGKGSVGMSERCPGVQQKDPLCAFGQACGGVSISG